MPQSFIFQCTLFLLPPIFVEDTLTFWLESTKWLTVLITTFILQDQPQGYILSYFYKLLGLYFSPECLLNFLSIFYITPCMGKSFKFMVFKFLDNALNIGIFTHVSLPHAHLKLFPKFLHGEWNYLFPRAAFFRKFVIEKLYIEKFRSVWTIHKYAIFGFWFAFANCHLSSYLG